MIIDCELGCAIRLQGRRRTRGRRYHPSDRAGGSSPSVVRMSGAASALITSSVARQRAPSLRWPQPSTHLFALPARSVVPRTHACPPSPDAATSGRREGGTKQTASRSPTRNGLLAMSSQLGCETPTSEARYSSALLGRLARKTCTPPPPFRPYLKRSRVLLHAWCMSVYPIANGRSAEMGIPGATRAPWYPRGWTSGFAGRHCARPPSAAHAAGGHSARAIESRDSAGSIAWKSCHANTWTRPLRSRP